MCVCACVYIIFKKISSYKGLFLVRGSTRGDGGFVLSIWMGTAARHFQIRREVVNGGNALTFDTPSGSAPHFSSM